MSKIWKGPGILKIEARLKDGRRVIFPGEEVLEGYLKKERFNLFVEKGRIGDENKKIVAVKDQNLPASKTAAELEKENARKDKSGKDESGEGKKDK